MSEPTDGGASRGTGCDQEALAALAAGPLPRAARARVVEHLQHCSACQRTFAWLRQVDSLVGLPVEGHVPAGVLVAFVDGELSADQREQVQRHLDACESCRLLAAAARGGLDEADAVEQGIATQARWAAASQERPAESEEPAVPLHLLASIPLAMQPRATAADTATAGAPSPEDRRVLVDAPELFRAVYFRRGAQGCVGVFSEGSSPAEVLSCCLEGEEIAPASRDEEGATFELGPATELPGRTLVLRVHVARVERSLSWTFIAE